MAAGESHTLVLLSDGTVWGWGYNAMGQLFDGTTYNRTVPTKSTLEDVVAIAAGRFSSFVVKNDQTILCAGRANEGETGQPELSELSGIAKIAAGTAHVLATKSDGTVVSWGRNVYGQLGHGTASAQEAPAVIPGLADVIQVAAGEEHSLALTADGVLWAWGDNTYGQFGDIKENNRLQPGSVYGIGDDMGNSWEDAIPISNLSAQETTIVRGKIDIKEDADWYRFTAPASGALSLMTVSDVPTLLFVYDAAGAAANTPLGATQADGSLLTVEVAQGTEYYIKVTGNGLVEDTWTGYTLSLSMSSWQLAAEYSMYIGDVGGILDLYVTARNLPAVSDQVFRLVYDPVMLDLKDTVGITEETELTVGTYGDVKILSVSDGDIVFQKTGVEMSDDQRWQGVLNLIRFAVRAPFSTTIQLYMLEQAE